MCSYVCSNIEAHPVCLDRAFQKSAKWVSTTSGGSVGFGSRRPAGQMPANGNPGSRLCCAAKLGSRVPVRCIALTAIREPNPTRRLTVVETHYPRICGSQSPLRPRKSRSSPTTTVEAPRGNISGARASPVDFIGRASARRIIQPPGIVRPSRYRRSRANLIFGTPLYGARRTGQMPYWRMAEPSIAPRFDPPSDPPTSKVSARDADRSGVGDGGRCCCSPAPGSARRGSSRPAHLLATGPARLHTSNRLRRT